MGNSWFLLVQGKVKSLSRVQLFATLWTVTYQASPSMGFSRQEYWSGLPFPSPGDLPDPGIEPGSPALQANALTSEPPGKPNCHQFCSFRQLPPPLTSLYLIIPGNLPCVLHAKSLQRVMSDSLLPHGLGPARLHVRMLELVAMPSSRGPSWHRN